jgi:hypothetical protein
MSDRRFAELVAIIPAAAVGGLYLLFLGHRHDYLGHFAAGYGASFCAMMVGIKSISQPRYQRLAIRAILPACALCILLGAMTEVTIFRIARFDELDFFNQSLGAVLAAVAALAFVRPQRPADREFDVATIIGIVFLSLGGWFAFA